MRSVTRSLKLIDRELRENEEANRLFLEILTSRNNAETVLRRMNEAGVLGRFVPDFGRVVSMMQFNMYHHYTVDEHLLRCIGMLAEIERGDNKEVALASDLMRTIQPQHRALLYVALFLHDIAKGRIEDHSIAGARIARRLCPRFGLSAAETETVAWLVEIHLVMSTVAQSRDLSDRKTIENFAAVVQSLERMKLLDHPHHRRHPRGRAGRMERLEGPAPAHALLRDRTGAHRRLLGGQPGAARGHGPGRAQGRACGLAARAARRLCCAPLPGLLAQGRPAAHGGACALRARRRGCRKVARHHLRLRCRRGVTELTVLAPDHPWLLSTLAGACAAAGANIVDAQIFTTTDGRALDTLAVSREFEHDDDEARRAARIADAIEKALRGDLKLPDVVAAAQPEGTDQGLCDRARGDDQQSWSNRYTVVEVTGLDRPGLLYELTSTLSKLNLNIASAHVATFGERVVDVFYVTDLLGAKITSPTRETDYQARAAGALQQCGSRQAEDGCGVTRRAPLGKKPWLAKRSHGDSC